MPDSGSHPGQSTREITVKVRARRSLDDAVGVENVEPDTLCGLGFAFDADLKVTAYRMACYCVDSEGRATDDCIDCGGSGEGHMWQAVKVQSCDLKRATVVIDRG